MRISAAALLLFVCCFICAANAHNITKILEGFPDYSEYNSYLTRTKLADEINSRTTITVLVVDNGAMAALEGKGLSLSAIKRVLSLHVMLDYFDPAKLHEITNGTTLSTTLLQTTGAAPGNTGFLNVTDLKGGKVGFGPATRGSKLPASFVKSVKEVPFNISVIQISQLVVPPLAEAPSPAPSEVNITALLLKFGHKTFAGLLAKTPGVLKTYQEDVDGGLTIFAPADAAFAGARASLKKLSDADVTSLLEYHAVPVYSPLGTLKTTNGHIRTLATTTPSKYVLTVSSSGDTVMLNTGVDKATITRTLVDDQPLAIFSVDKLLQPKELFTAPPAPAPAPALPSTPDSSPPAPAPGSKFSGSVAAGPADGPASPDTAKKDASFAPASGAGGSMVSAAAALAFGVLLMW